jgi:hypothetical protein
MSFKQIILMIVNEQYKYSGLTAKIIGCAMAVHKTLGNARLTGRAGLPGTDLPAGFGNRNECSRH